jgi:hypothetical protein
LQAEALSASQFPVTECAQPYEPRGWTDHAVARASDRFGIEPTPFEWRQLLLDIIDAAGCIGLPRAILLRRESDTEHWAALIKRCPVVAVYHPDTACIITLTPFARRLAERHDMSSAQREHAPRRKNRAERYRPQWGDEE